jgi:hypothetical protein
MDGLRSAARHLNAAVLSRSPPLFGVRGSDAKIDSYALLIARDEFARPDLQRKAVNSSGVDLEDNIDRALEAGVYGEYAHDLVTVVAHIFAKQPGLTGLQPFRAGGSLADGHREEHSGCPVRNLAVLDEECSDRDPRDCDLAIVDLDSDTRDAIDHLKVVVGVAEP